MCSTKFIICAVVILCAIAASCHYDNPKPAVTSSDSTVVSKSYSGKSDWSVYMDAPRYHFVLAMEYLRKGEYSKSSMELTRGNSFLSFQSSRISAIVNEIDKLSKSLISEKHENIALMDTLIAKAMKVLSNEYVMIPLDVGADLVFKEEYDYLFDKAKTNVQNNNRLEAADEIRRASSLIRLKAAQTGLYVTAELDSGEIALRELSLRVASGVNIDIKELESAFIKAAHVFNQKKN